MYEFAHKLAAVPVCEPTTQPKGYSVPATTVNLAGADMFVPPGSTTHYQVMARLGQSIIGISMLPKGLARVRIQAPELILLQVVDHLQCPSHWGAIKNHNHLSTVVGRLFIPQAVADAVCAVLRAQLEEISHGQ